MSGNRHDDEDQDAGIAELLREVGVRDEPGPGIANEIRAAVHAEWQTTLAKRRQRKRIIGIGMAAGVGALSLGLALVMNFSSTPNAELPLLASIARIQGDTQSGAVQLRSVNGNAWHDVASGDKLVAGVVVRTDATTSVAIDFGNGLFLRVDHGSLLQLIAKDRVELQRGRVYVDAPVDSPAKQHMPLVVQTRYGAIQHLGTQYQAQLRADDVLIGVREGRVSIASKGANVEVGAGEGVVMAEQGEIARQPLSPRDSTWDWSLQSAPMFEIENHSLASFLEWVARETGCTVHYDSPEARKEAEALILRGSVATLTPDQALTAVLATTRLTQKTHDGTIDIRL